MARVRAGEEYPLRDATERIIGCCIEVHRALGPGLLEAVYEEALAHEFSLQGVSFERQRTCALEYKGRAVGNHRVDLLVDGAIVVEVKACDGHQPLFEAQVLSYMKALGVHVGLLVNFNARRLTDGVKRFVM